VEPFDFWVIWIGERSITVRMQGGAVLIIHVVYQDVANTAESELSERRRRCFLGRSIGWWWDLILKILKLTGKKWPVF